MLLIAIFAVTLIAIDRDKDNYTYENVLKREMVKTVPQPRIIFVGGSNLAFGLDSKTVGESLGKNVINNGLHAGLGLKFMLDDIEPFLQKGDTVVICPEYNHFYGAGAYGGVEALPMLVEYRPEIIKLFNYRQIAVVLRGLPMIFNNRVHGLQQKLFKRTTPSNIYQYSKSVFNEYGDEVSHLTLKSDNPHICASTIQGDFDEGFYQYFLSKMAAWNSRGICVIMLPPAIYSKHLNVNIAKANNLAQRLAASGMPFKTSSQTFAYPESMMYNTNYHLNKLGVVARTQDVIKALSD